MPEPAPPSAASLVRSDLRLPTFLIIGANKAGTTSLYHYLGSHPQVFMSPVKEPHFFTYQGHVPQQPEDLEATRLLPPEAAALGTLEDYAGLFADAGPEQLALGEASTGYLCGEHIPRKVHDVLPEARLVAVLRDPSERAWSEFLMMRRLGEEPEASLTAIVETRSGTRYVELGRYGAALERWFARYPREQLRIHRFEDLSQHAGLVVADILDFLGVDARVRIDTRERHNPRRRSEPGLDRETRAALIEVFRPDIERVEELLGWDLSAWKAVDPPRGYLTTLTLPPPAKRRWSLPRLGRWRD